MIGVNNENSGNTTRLHIQCTSFDINITCNKNLNKAYVYRYGLAMKMKQELLISLKIINNV